LICEQKIKYNRFKKEHKKIPGTCPGDNHLLYVHKFQSLFFILKIILISGAANFGGVITITFIKCILPSFRATNNSEYYYCNGQNADKPFNRKAYGNCTTNAKSKPQKISSAHFFHSNNTP